MMNITQYFSLEVAKVPFGESCITVVHDTDSSLIYYNVYDLISVVYGPASSRNNSKIINRHKKKVSITNIHGVSDNSMFVSTVNMMVLAKELSYNHCRRSSTASDEIANINLIKEIFQFSKVAPCEFKNAEVVEKEYQLKSFTLNGHEINSVFAKGGIAVKVNDVRKYLGKSTRSGLSGAWKAYPFTLKVKGRNILFVMVDDLIPLAKGSSFSKDLIELHKFIIENNGFMVRPYILHQAKESCLYHGTIINAKNIDGDQYYHLSGLYRALGFQSFGDTVRDYATVFDNEYWITKEDMVDFISANKITHVQRSKWKEFLSVAK